MDIGQLSTYKHEVANGFFNDDMNKKGFIEWVCQFFCPRTMIEYVWNSGSNRIFVFSVRFEKHKWY